MNPDTILTPLEAMQEERDLLYRTLARLVAEATHYRNTGKGVYHLNVALADAQAVMRVAPRIDGISSGEWVAMYAALAATRPASESVDAVPSV